MNPHCGHSSGKKNRKNHKAFKWFKTGNGLKHVEEGLLIGETHSFWFDLDVSLITCIHKVISQLRTRFKHTDNCTFINSSSVWESRLKTAIYQNSELLKPLSSNIRILHSFCGNNSLPKLAVELNSKYSWIPQMGGFYETDTWDSEHNQFCRIPLLENHFLGLSFSMFQRHL